MAIPKLLVFASGGPEDGGSGAKHLILNSMGTNPILQADIVGLVSNHENGGVRTIADMFKVPFYHFSKPWDEKGYQKFVKETQAEWVALSGWLKFVLGLDTRTTFNIHPVKLSILNDKGKPRFGGRGFHGRHVHEAIMKAHVAGEAGVKESGVSMHFINSSEYDGGDLFFEYPVPIAPDDDSESLGSRVNRYEHGWQSFITNLVVTGQIRMTEGGIIVPNWYNKQVYCPEPLRLVG